MRDRIKRSRSDALLEVPIGILLGVAALLPLAFVIRSLETALDGQWLWPALSGVIAR